VPTTEAETEERITRADAAYHAALDVAPSVRAAWLDAVARSLEHHSPGLVALAARETSLGEDRLRGELRRTAFQLRLLGEEIEAGLNLQATIDHADPEWGMGPRPDIRRANVPLGVVGVFGASNFPFAFSVIGGDSASALAAGCAVVHKIHEGHPELGARVGEIVTSALEAAGAPAGIFSTITGQGAGGTLVDHPFVQAIGFTGSTRAGRMLFDRASRRPTPIPFYGELGSINPVFVAPSAWNSRRSPLIAGYVSSFTLGMGQFCTKPGVLIIPSGPVDDLREAIAEALGGRRWTPMLTPAIRRGYEENLSLVRGMAGVSVLIDGDGAESPSPTVLLASGAVVLDQPEILRTEMFGPATLVVQYEGPEQLLELASLFDGQLTATVHAEADDEVSELLRLIRERSGRLVWNGWPTGVSVTYAQQHGGPYPATTQPGSTSVGTAAIGRFMRPVAYESFPSSLLPPSIQDANPWGIVRRIDGGPLTIDDWKRDSR
jgi:NADP-dependent aldehyde dehydrogenase